jgi:hypothetical protein
MRKWKWAEVKISFLLPPHIKLIKPVRRIDVASIISGLTMAGAVGMIRGGWLYSGSCIF